MSSPHLLSTEDQLIGRIIAGKYRLRTCVGAGASGAVYKADQIALGRTVAVKILKPELALDNRLVKRFEDEAVAVSKLNHPNTVSVIDYGQTKDGLLFLVLEFLRGQSLGEILFWEFPMARNRIGDFMTQILCGLEEAHHAGVVHADLKPENIFVEHRRGGWELVKVIDFGISRIIGRPSHDEPTMICGTPEYMAPEVILGGVPKFASDLYAAGIILYEALTGQTPFGGGTTEDVLSKHLKQAPVPPSRVRPELTSDDALQGVALRALAKTPQDRFRSAAEFRLAVQEAIAGPVEQDDGASLECAACGVVAKRPFKFCPDCGQPRRPMAVTAEVHVDVADTLELTTGEQRALSLVPAVTVESVEVPFVGREIELAKLRACVRDNTCSAVQVSGLMGAGRTELVDRVCSEASQHGVRIFRTERDPSRNAVAFYPLRRLVAQILEVPVTAQPHQVRDAVERVGLAVGDTPGISELFGHGLLVQLDPPGRRRELFTSVIRVLNAAPSAAPSIFVFDDVDAYDRPSQELLRRVASEPSASRTCIFVNQPEFIRFWPVNVERIHLNAVANQHVEELCDYLRIRMTTDLPAAEDFVVKTVGVPLHIVQLVRFLCEGGGIDSAPDSIADLIEMRLSFLPHSALLLCQTIAIYGDQVHRDTLRFMPGVELGGAFETTLSLLKSRGFIFENGATVGFTQSVIRDVVYDTTPAHVRQDLHRAAGSALQTTLAPSAELGRHREVCGDWAAAADFLMVAGDHAVRMFDDDGASELYRRALHCARHIMLQGDDGEHRSRFVLLSVKLADTLRSSGACDLARGVLHEAHDACDGLAGLEAQVLHSRAKLHVAEEQYPEAISAIRSAIGGLIRVGRMDLLLELYSTLARVYLQAGDAELAVTELEEGLGIVTMGTGASAKDGPRELWRLLVHLAELHRAIGKRPQALFYAEFALKHARRVGSVIGSAQVQTLLGEHYERDGNPELASRYRAAAVEEYRRLGDRRATAELLLRSSAAVSTTIETQSTREGERLADEIGWRPSAKRAGVTAA